jgi:hypothetical protein
LTGGDLLEMLKTQLPALPPLAHAALAATTVAEHRRTLVALQKHLADTPTLHPVPIAKLLVLYVLQHRVTRRWRWATTMKNACMLQGSLAILPMYRDVAMPINLAELTIWRQLLRAIARKTKEELPQQPLAATWVEVEQVLRSPSVPAATRAAIMISWFTAQRVGCVLQLDTRDCVLRQGRLAALFRKGKTVPFRGPYTVHTGPLPDWAIAFLADFLRRHTSFKDTTGAKVKEALRTVNSRLEQRSLRRGSLQTLAKDPAMTDELLLWYSGHTSVRMLLRYLGWGMQAAHRARATARVDGTSLADPHT